jgi:hypothetical protein
LKFVGIDLPSTYEVHFCNEGEDETITVLGNADGVEIPDQFLTDGAAVRAWVFLHTGNDDGETEYAVRMPVTERPQPSDIQPTPVQQDIITQAIAALNTAVTETSASAQAAAQDAQTASQAAQTATTKAGEASQSATRAENAAASITTPDATLTQAGVAADAKATGDEISDLKEDLQSVSLVVNGGSSVIPTVTTVTSLKLSNGATSYTSGDWYYKVKYFPVVSGLAYNITIHKQVRETTAVTARIGFSTEIPANGVVTTNTQVTVSRDSLVYQYTATGNG